MTCADPTAPLTLVADLSSLPGLTYLYDPGNGPEAVLVPLGIDGDKVLLVSTGPAFPRTGADLGPQRWRAYQVDLSTGSAELVGYERGIAGE